MIRELLKIIKEAEVMLDTQSQRLSEFDEKVKKAYHELKQINDKLEKVNSKDKSANKD